MAIHTLTDKSGTIVCACSNGCRSEFQDTRYGKGLRVHNLKAKKENGSAKCTVCGTVRH